MLRGKLLDTLTFGPHRRRRWMMRRLRELDLLDQAARHRPGHGFRPLLKAVAVLAVFTAGSAVFLHQELGIPLSLDGISAARRLAAPPESSADSGAFAFVQTDRGRPVGYDPCRPVRLVVNDTLAPPGADSLVQQAAVRVSAATGLGLEVDGTTDELPSDGRPLRQPWRYGSSWAPVLVAWTTPDVEPRLRGDVAGIGGSVAVPSAVTGRLRYVTGSVALDAPALTRLLARPNGRALVRAVIMHELAHVVGLAHVEDPAELMHDDNVGRTRFGPGDLAGLAQVGAISRVGGPCY